MLIFLPVKLTYFPGIRYSAVLVFACLAMLLIPAVDRVGTLSVASGDIDRLKVPYGLLSFSNNFPSTYSLPLLRTLSNTG